MFVSLIEGVGGSFSSLGKIYDVFIRAVHAVAFGTILIWMVHYSYSSLKPLLCYRYYY